MNESPPFQITRHAMERYCERVDPGLPLGQIRDPKTAMNDAKIAMERGFASALVLDVRTNDGHEQRRIERPYPCVLVCKPDAGSLVISTVLGPNETILAEDEEIFAAYAGTIRDGLERGTLDALSTRKPRAAETTEEFVRRHVAAQIEANMDARLKKAARVGLTAAVDAVKVLQRLALTDQEAAFEVEMLRGKFPMVFDVIERREEIAR